MLFFSLLLVVYDEHGGCSMLRELYEMDAEYTHGRLWGGIRRPKEAGNAQGIVPVVDTSHDPKLCPGHCFP